MSDILLPQGETMAYISSAKHRCAWTALVVACSLPLCSFHLQTANAQSQTVETLTGDRIPIRNFIDNLRAEIRSMTQEAANAEPSFLVKDFTVKLTVGYEVTADGRINYWIIDAGADISRTATHELLFTVSLEEQQRISSENEQNIFSETSPVYGYLVSELIGKDIYVLEEEEPCGRIVDVVVNPDAAPILQVQGTEPYSYCHGTESFDNEHGIVAGPDGRLYWPTSMAGEEQELGDEPG